MYETFITVHNQDLIIQLEKNRIFKNLKQYRYILLGDSPTDKLKKFKNVIIARECPDNIEQHKNLCDFTGWYAIVKNNLIRKPFVCLIQYDSLIFPNFDKSVKHILKKHPDKLIGFQQAPMNVRDFLGDPFAASAIKTIGTSYKTDIPVLVEETIRQGDIFWPAATSICCSREIISDFVDWVQPLLNGLVTDPMAGHSVERSVKFFCLIRKIKNRYLPTVLEHIFACSHKQSYIPDEIRIQHQQRNKLFLEGKLPEQKTMNSRYFLQRVFSLKNSRTKSHKIINIFGFTLKIRK